jgi:hypothetical protein
MSSTYTRWIDHGEDRNIHVLEELAVVEDANVDSSVPEHTNDGCGLEEMLGELVRSEQHRNEARSEDGDEGAASHFKQLIEDAKRELYPGCMNFTRFTFVIKMLHVKSYYRITNSAFSATMKILSEAFPQFNTIPKSYDEAKKMLRELGLGYESIHVCPNNCVLFRKENKKRIVVQFVGHQDGKIMRGRRFQQKYCGIFHWSPGCKGCLFRRKDRRKHSGIS